MSLRIRLAAVLAVVATLGIAAASIAAYVSTSRALYTELDRSLVDRARRAVQELGPGAPAAPIPAGNGPLLQVIGRDGVARTDVRGTFPLPIDDVDIAVARNGGVAFHDVSIDGVTYRLRVQSVPIGAVQVARDLTETRSILHTLRVRLIVLALTGGVAAALFAWLVARRAIRPVEQLTDAAEHVARTEDLSTPIPVERHDELGRLATSFNSMLHALGASREEQRRLVDDAGHELRTPLTSLRTNIEVLQQSDRLPVADRRRLLDDVGAELHELTSLVDELVALARGASDEPITEVRLDQVVRDAVERCRRRTGREIDVTADEVVVRGRRAQLDRAVANLLGNAAKFSPTSTPIEVHVADRRVAVRDHGPGISASDRAHVFERFYRAESARATSGSGLGLAIVDQVARAHDGAVFVDDAPGGGAIVGFSVA